MRGRTIVGQWRPSGCGLCRRVLMRRLKSSPDPPTVTLRVERLCFASRKVPGEHAVQAGMKRGLVVLDHRAEFRRSPSVFPRTNEDSIILCRIDGRFMLGERNLSQRSHELDPTKEKPPRRNSPAIHSPLRSSKIPLSRTPRTNRAKQSTFVFPSASITLPSGG